MGVLAVDPTSPFTGGAILGDRIRMQDHATDPGVFIRSLATRGNLGGLSRATGDCIRVMDAMGQDVILVETVGVGQDEIDIAQMAHTTLRGAGARAWATTSRPSRPASSRWRTSSSSTRPTSTAPTAWCASCGRCSSCATR